LLLLVFILENSQRADTSDFGAHGHLPPGVALLLAGVLGMLLAVIEALGRRMQQRNAAPKSPDLTTSAAPHSHDGVGGRIRPARQPADHKAGRPSRPGTRDNDPCRRQTEASAVGHTRRGRISMWRSVTRLSLPVTLLAAGLLAAGCGGTISSSIGSLPSRTATAPARPSVTAAPATQPPATGSAAPVASSGTSLIWLWVLLGVLVLAGLIALIARSSRRRSAAAAGWRSGLVDAYAKGSALHDAMSVAEAPGGLAAADAAARWSDIQRRADDLAQTLYALREEVPQHSPDGARIADTLASLQAVRSAMDAERAPGGASLEQADVVRSRLASFESSLRALAAPAQ
jgi:hypothetical protein